MRIGPRLALTLAMAAAAAAARGDDAPKAKVTTEYDVVYARPAGDDLKLDMARPAEGDGPSRRSWSSTEARGGPERRPTIVRSSASSPAGVTWPSPAISVLPQGDLSGTGPRREGRRPLAEGPRRRIQGRTRQRRRDGLLRGRAPRAAPRHDGAGRRPRGRRPGRRANLEGPGRGQLFRADRPSPPTTSRRSPGRSSATCSAAPRPRSPTSRPRPRH